VPVFRHPHKGDEGEHRQNQPLRLAGLGQLLVLGLYGLEAALNAHTARLEIVLYPPLRQHKHTQIRPLQLEPIEVRQTQCQLRFEQTHQHQIRQMRGHNHHAANHGAVNQRLNHDRLLGGLFFRRITE